MYRFQPILVFVVVTLVGLLAATASWYTIDQTNRMSFAAIVESTVQRLGDRVENHMLLIKSTQALFEAIGDVPSAEQFRKFVDHLRKAEQFSGVQGIGFARYVRSGGLSDTAISAEIGRNYGLARAPWPATSEDYRTPIVLLEPNTERNARALGYDMFSEPTRRAAILAALAERRLRASGSVELVQENSSDVQAGFLMYMPFFAINSGRPLGFVYAPFRIGDLFESVLKRNPVLPVHITAWDGEPAQSSMIFNSLGNPSSRIGVPQGVMASLEVAGSTWTFQIHPSQAYSPPVDQTRSYMLAIGAVLLAGALAAASHSQQRTIEVGKDLRQETERALTEREFLLQEMKHRIKNMIARVLAMSRQTARTSETLDEFTGSFTARLQAMAASQDLLARSSWQGADLKTLLVQELRQLFGDELDEDRLGGPQVELNETATQAFGLAFHELATNALKYGSARLNTGTLNISWSVEQSPDSKQAELVVNWSERSVEPMQVPGADALSGKGGFGTKLLDATMRVELGGSIVTVPGTFGIDVTITVPHERVVSSQKAATPTRQ